MPSRTTRPRPISPTMRPAPSGVEGPAPSEIEGSPTRTRASVTRCTTARTLLPDLKEVGCGFVRQPQRGAVAQLAARIEPRVEEEPGHHVAELLEHRLLDAGVFLLEIEDPPLHTLALKAQVTARGAAAADDWQLPLLRIQPGLGFFDVHERADDHVLAVVGHEPRRHRLERAGKEQVQQQRLDEVVQMMTEGNLRRADLGGDSVEHPAPQA